MKKMFLLFCAAAVLTGCTFTIPAKKKPLSLNTSPKATSNVLFTYDKTQVKDFDPATDSITLSVDILNENPGYSVKDLMEKLRIGPNSLKLELPSSGFFVVDGQVEERLETSFDTNPVYQGQKLWAGVFKYTDRFDNEIWLAVNEYSKEYFLKKKTGSFIDLACVFPKFTKTEDYLSSYRLTLNCFPISQEESTIVLDNPDKK